MLAGVVPLAQPPPCLTDLSLVFEAVMLGMWPVALRCLLIFSLCSRNYSAILFYFQFPSCCIIRRILLRGEQQFTESCWNISFIPQRGVLYMLHMSPRAAVCWRSAVEKAAMAAGKLFNWMKLIWWYHEMEANNFAFCFCICIMVSTRRGELPRGPPVKISILLKDRWHGVLLRSVMNVDKCLWQCDCHHVKGREK